MVRPSPYERQYRIALVVLVVIVAVALVGVWLVWGEDLRTLWNNRALAQSFGGHEQTLYEKADAIVKAAGGYGDNVSEPKLRGGKAAWVQVKRVARRSRNETIVTLDDDFGRIPADLRAPDPSSVETIVLLYPSSARVGVYVREGSVPPAGPGASGTTLDAFAESLDVHLVDVRNNRYLGRKRFAWQPKGRVDVLRESHIQERNSKEVIDWYVDLPDK